MADVKPIPDDYPRVIPYLSIDGASAAIEFYRTVFGANERMRMPAPDGKIGHAELELGDSVIMLADVFPEMGGPSPKSLGGSPVTLIRAQVVRRDAHRGRPARGDGQARRRRDEWLSLTRRRGSSGPPTPSSRRWS